MSTATDVEARYESLTPTALPLTQVESADPAGDSAERFVPASLSSRPSLDQRYAAFGADMYPDAGRDLPRIEYDTGPRHRAALRWPTNPYLALGPDALQADAWSLHREPRHAHADSSQAESNRDGILAWLERTYAAPSYDADVSSAPVAAEPESAPAPEPQVSGAFTESTQDTILLRVRHRSGEANVPATSPLDAMPPPDPDADAQAAEDVERFKAAHERRASDRDRHTGMHRAAGHWSRKPSRSARAAAKEVPEDAGKDRNQQFYDRADRAAEVVRQDKVYKKRRLGALAMIGLGVATIAVDMALQRHGGGSSLRATFDPSVLHLSLSVPGMLPAPEVREQLGAAANAVPVHVARVVATAQQAPVMSNADSRLQRVGDYIGNNTGTLAVAALCAAAVVRGVVARRSYQGRHRA